MNKTLALAIAGTMLVGGAAFAGRNEPPAGGRLIQTEAGRALTSTAAVIGSDGTVVRATPHTTVILPDGSADGNYRVEFAKGVAKCVFTGTLGTTGSLGTVSPGFLTVAGDALSVTGVFVTTYDATGTLAPSSFHLLVSC